MAMAEVAVDLVVAGAEGVVAVTEAGVVEVVEVVVDFEAAAGEDEVAAVLVVAVDMTSRPNQ